MKTLRSISLAAALAATLAAPAAFAGAVHDAGLFTTVLARNDDGSTGSVGIGFSIHFYGLSAQSTLFVNNNGNVTFTGPLSTFTPFGLLTSTIPIIAPFFADVDTRNLGSDVVRYGTGSIGGRSVFGVNWIDVGYFGSHADKLNSFQLIITNRSDIAAGDFDFEFNYDKIQWETGDASGGSGGFGGSPARAGWTDGGATDFEFVGSGVTRAFLDAGPNSLIAGSLNSTTAGQYIFRVRGGTVIGGVPEPTSLALVSLALLGAAVAARKKRAA